MSQPLTLTHYTLTSALGNGVDAHADALIQSRGGLAQQAFPGLELETAIGLVDTDSVALPAALSAFDCRNNRLAEAALGGDGFIEAVVRARATHGAHRVATILGTSTSGLLQSELAYAARGHPDEPLPDWYRYVETQNTFSVADYVRRRLDLEGYGLVISTACSSSAKAFGTAARAIAADVCDAAVVGGVDSLCLTTLYGFNSLQVLDSRPCRPTAADRRGISIGEAGGFALLERYDERSHVHLLGCGESSDAHHMSQPHPEGLGAEAAMRHALGEYSPDSVDYINLHGTGTPANDGVEDLAVHRIFGNGVPASSTKSYTGHTLGAAGIVEALIAALSIERGVLPRTLNAPDPDPSFQAQYVTQSRRAPVCRVVSNSYGFGGSNASLLLGTTP